MGMDRSAESSWGQMRAFSTIHRAIFSPCFMSMGRAAAGAVSGGNDKDDATLGGGDNCPWQ